MPLPPSFGAMGFKTPDEARRLPGRRSRRMMIRTEGRANSGKTEFLLSCPGPGLIIAADRGFDAMMDNPKPPVSRRADFGLKVIRIPAAGQFSQASDYLPFYKEFWQTYMGALQNADAVTVAIDGDNHTWDCQRLAEHGKLTGVFPATRYSGVYSARRNLYWQAWDTGKVIISTNMLREEYVPEIGADGQPVMEGTEVKKIKSGQYVSSGFPDYEYLWQIRLLHLYKEPGINRLTKKPTPPLWGVRILEAKANKEMVGEELWGDACSFEGVVSLIYPHIDPKEWGL